MFISCISNNVKACAANTDHIHICISVYNTCKKYIRYWWQEYEQFCQKQTWCNVPFYWIESYLFRIILEHSEYFNAKNKSTYKVDPFGRQKLREIMDDTLWGHYSKQVKQLFNSKVDDKELHQQLALLLFADLWANTVDLNFKPVRMYTFICIWCICTLYYVCVRTCAKTITTNNDNNNGKKKRMRKWILKSKVKKTW
ncbi:hypothetical protein RFI_27641 [Reticulomyxa filosa]|uniref:Uncharacterized protein n=1 Tax=Reticulomyxa filosa TaxID=46433 RepID=X6M8D8_RETFI|nr:hypothetical protein RFI_27641 [Reticulomyxa filosa]|eukprot:ETO09737.1 hypothetical protein RFI_27641 [Reticulomyxa filosa]